MDNRQAAEGAIARLDNTEFLGKKIHVEVCFRPIVDMFTGFRHANMNFDSLVRLSITLETKTGAAVIGSCFHLSPSSDISSIRLTQ